MDSRSVRVVSEPASALEWLDLREESGSEGCVAGWVGGASDSVSEGGAVLAWTLVFICGEKTFISCTENISKSIKYHI